MNSIFKVIVDQTLFVSCVFLLFGSIYLTFKTKFIQFRLIPLFFSRNSKRQATKKEEKGGHTISPSKALFTAMSTTLGISTIVGPVIAIQLGGPGALFGFLLTSFFGSAATYVEVNLGVRYRTRSQDGKVLGGPMQYLKEIFSQKMAKGYAICCLLLMIVWSAAQANQLAAVLNSPSLGTWRIDPIYSGIFLALIVLVTLRGGIRWIGNLSSKLVPVMFVLYIGSSFWIIGSNLSLLGSIFHEMVMSMWTPYPMASGVLVGGAISALRWGVFKGVQATEAGVGTQTIPHSLAETADPQKQGILAMFSTFAAGGVSFLSGCVAMITRTWQDSSLPLGAGMVLASYEQYFSFIGVTIVCVCAFLFGFGTILGNSFNGSQCYGYLTKQANPWYFLLGMALMIFLGAIGEVVVVWSYIDIVLASMAIPHMFALLWSIHKQPEFFMIDVKKEWKMRTE